MVSRNRHPSLPGIISLILLTAVLGYGTFSLGVPIAQSGSQGRQHRQLYLLALGILGLVYWMFASRKNPARRSDRGLQWSAILLPVYAALQLVPLPLFVVRILSPARAELSSALAPLVPVHAFVPLSVTPAATLSLVLLMAGYAVLFLLVRDIASRAPDHPWLPAAPVVLVAALQAVIGLAQYFGYGTESYAHGTYTIRNHFAGLLEMAFPFPIMYAAATWWRADDPRRSTLGSALRASLGLALAALLLLGIFCSLSRMGSFAALGSLLVIGLVAAASQWTAPAKRALLVLCLLLPLVFGLLAPPRLILRFAEVTGRTPAWRDTWRLITAYPLAGCGLGGYESAFLKFKRSDPLLNQDYAHNDYLQFLAELGVAGFSIAAAFLLLVLATSIRAAASHPLPDRRFLALACTGAITAILIHSAVDFNLYVPANAAVLAWICGLAAAQPAAFGNAGDSAGRHLSTFEDKVTRSA